MNTDALESFATGRPTNRKIKEPWAPPTRESFLVPDDPGIRWVIAIDQSLSACGVVMLAGSRIGGQVCLHVKSAWKIATEASDLGGFEEHMARSEQLHDKLREFLIHARFATTETTEVVNEAPPVGGGRIRTPEASYLSALAIRLAVKRHGFRVAKMVPPQVHKNFVCGDRKASKTEHHAALKRLAVDLRIERFNELIKNEATRDALSIGLYHLTREGLRR